jgi:hypothetical protein
VARPLLTLPVLVAGLAGLALSTIGSLTQACIDAFDDSRQWCSPVAFEAWWGFWVSLAAVPALLLALALTRRRGRWWALLLAVAAAALALSPIPYDLWAPDSLRDALQKLRS